MADKIEMNSKCFENICSATDSNVIDNVFFSGDPIGHSTLSLADVYEYKRKELDKIHQDLNDLMARLNSFIDDQGDLYDFVEEKITQQNREQDNSEKQDGPSEKELIKQIYTGLTPEDICKCDDEYPTGVNWDMLAPFVENVAGDLQRIRQLNQMPNSVMDRIKCLTSENKKDDEKE